jgi:hypothetical protein
MGNDILNSKLENKNITIFLLSIIAIILILIVSIAGFVLDDGGKSYSFSSLRGEKVEIYGGHGLYQYDSIYKAVEFKGYNWINLIIGLPLFLLGLYLFFQGNLKGQLILAGLFTHYAYNYLIGVMGNAFNIMFLFWTALFSVSMFGLFFVLKSIDYKTLQNKLEKSFPRKSLSIYIIIFGLLFYILYLPNILTSYISGNPPASLEIYTTLELASLEMGIMAPLSIIGGILLLKKKTVGYIIVITLIFASMITFLSLSISALFLYFFYHKGTFNFQFILLSLISIAFISISYKNIKG